MPKSFVLEGWNMTWSSGKQAILEFLKRLHQIPREVQGALGLVLLLLGAGLLQWLLRAFVARWLARLGRRVDGPLAILLHRDVLRRGSQTVLPLVVHLGVQAVPHLSAALRRVIENVALAVTVLMVARTLMRILQAMLEAHTQQAANHGQPGSRSVKMYVQIGQLIVVVSAVVIMIAALSDKSPLIVLSGFGAMSAVILLIFQDTLRSFAAGVQIESNDMLRVGDWIDMPQAGADGFVIDMALNTIKVQNWDKTIVTVPTWRLMSESFKNWRGMSEAGGRRILRTLQIDANSIHFLTDEEIDRLGNIKLLSEYIQEKRTAIRVSRAMVASELGPEMGSVPINLRRLTNIGTFRAYVQRYLEAHHFIRKDLWLFVRLLQPSESGVPLQLYCFTNTTVLIEYEAIQSDIFEHLLAVLPEFGLRVFQNPSDSGLRKAMQEWQAISAEQVALAVTAAQTDAARHRGGPSAPVG